MTAGPTLLIILDGFGHAEPGPDNAISLAHTPTWDRLWADGYRYVHIRTSSGLHVDPTFAGHWEQSGQRGFMRSAQSPPAIINRASTMPPRGKHHIPGLFTAQDISSMPSSWAISITSTIF